MKAMFGGLASGAFNILSVSILISFYLPIDLGSWLSTP